ncbi:MAG: NAD-dependent epimerase [Spirochaetia bacterium]|jgi:UDP-glucuronate 4-epimerase
MATLVTGAAGFIGFHLCRLLAKRGEQVVGTDSINDYYDPELKKARLLELGISPEDADSGALRQSRTLPGIRFQKLTLEERSGMEALFAEQRFARVCHLAAQAGVRYSLVNPRAYTKANVEGFLNVLEGCRTSGVRHLAFASSSSVYGLSRDIPFSERSHTDHPVSLYAASKKANEMMAHSYAHLYGLPVTGLRFFTVYGPWGRPDMAYYRFARAITDGVPIDLFNSGEMKRDFTYIDDVVEGIARILDHPAAPDASWDPANPDPSSSSAPFRIYNIGSNRAEPLARLVSELEHSLGRKAEYRRLPMQPGDVAATEADLSLMARDFGWRPSTTLEEGVRRFVEWFQSYHQQGRA